MSRISTLTAATRGDLPPPCISCTFWQHDRVVTDERRKEAWAESVQRRHGGFGRVLREGDGFRGMVQYGPAELFPRALALPAGPPGRDAALITCTYLEGDDPEGACERLLLEALADLKARDVAAVESFAIGYPDEVPSADRFLGHHTLFDRALLERFGFVVVRTSGQVALARIDLRATVPATAGRMARALRVARDALAPAPSGAPA
ncbi:hypothetical protein [Miltoncostaea oceani]|uniref:hypothetical protein n=1 Tax=Miltoncostaea oceani TaxID=2843216 RepID=UPI001C3C4EA9|nr:hypothetical protein [Miltoncostaea oceani]